MGQPSPLLASRAILVTGASSGIGRAVACEIAAAGGRVAALARTAGPLEALADEVEGVIAFPADVTDADAVSTAARRAAELFGGLDGVVANAGAGALGSLASGEPAKWRDLVELNFLGALVAARAALEHFRDDGPRDVVFVGSTAAHHPHALTGVYSASKSALAAAAESARLELTPRGVRVCLVEPGATRTGVLARAAKSPDVKVSTVLEGEFERLDPVDVARAIVGVLAQPEGVEVNQLVIRPTGQLR
jgi:NADP-dependent 3-hydroxy acid dehydrogenase YdfG